MKASPQKRAFSESAAAEWLERVGWHRAIAGDDDFALAAKAIAQMSDDPRRGLLLIGNVGVGKTCLAEKVFAGTRTDKVRINCADNDAVDDLVLPCDAQANGGVYNSAADDFLACSVLLDDLGSEAFRQVYGNSLDRIGTFIVRYHARGRGRLLVTTNLSLAQIEARYSSRVLDRLADRCVIVQFSGETKRRWDVIAREGHGNAPTSPLMGVGG